MATQGTTRLKIVNDQPSVEKLWNGRFRLEFFCDNDGKKKDWYGQNISRILPEYGIEMGDKFGEGEWSLPDGAEYDDMRLVEAETQFVPQAGTHYVRLAYETLTGAFVQEKDDDIDYELNGLKRVTRPFVALPGAAYTNVVGTTTITHDGTTLYLGSYKIVETDAKWTLKEIWLEAGKLSESEPLVGSDRIRVKTVVWQHIQGGDPEGYVASASKIDNIGGFKTITISYYFGEDLSTEFTYDTVVPFTVPGTVDWISSNLGAGANNRTLDVSPPIPTICSATITESYSTSTTEVNIAALYQPNFWTKVIIEGLGLNFRPFTSTSTYVNHIALSSGTSLTGLLIGGINCIQGNRIYGGTTAYIRIDGPTSDPAGTTITINVDVQPVFRLLDGTQYYKKTVTTIDVPARG